MSNSNKKYYKSVLLIVSLCIIVSALAWTAASVIGGNAEKQALNSYLLLQQNITSSAAKAAATAWAEHTKNRLEKTEIEYLVLDNHVKPMVLIENSHCFFYSDAYAIYDNNDILSQQYFNKSLDRIYEIKKINGATVIEELFEGIRSNTSGSAFITNSYRTGKEYAVWSSFAADSGRYTLGISAPVKSILDYYGAGKLKIIAYATAAAVSLFLIFIAWLLIELYINYQKKISEIAGEVESKKAIIEDINQSLINKEDTLKKLSVLDSMTGLYNRSFFEQYMKEIDIEMLHPISLITADIDGLLQINDTYGRHMGDKLIIRVAEIIKENINPSYILARTSDDEYTVVMPNTPAETAEITAEKLKEASLKLNNENIIVTVSFATATKNNTGQSMDDMMKLVKEKLNVSKLNAQASSRSNVVSTLLNVLHERTSETQHHCERMRTIAIKVGEKLNYSNSQLNEIALLALLHDIGKVAISDIVLKKPEKLTSDEWDVMKEHCDVGYRIAISIPDLHPIAKDILNHHERWDGSGYPHGLKGNEISQNACIISIIDAYDAMTNDRLYHKAIPRNEAIAEIQRCAGTQFSPAMVGVFVSVMRENRNL